MRILLLLFSLLFLQANQQAMQDAMRASQAASDQMTQQMMNNLNHSSQSCLHIHTKSTRVRPLPLPKMGIAPPLIAVR
jgi:hypothetical protein